MKYIKKYEDSNFLGIFNQELALIKKISNFFIENDLSEVDINVDGELTTIVYGYYLDSDTKWPWQLVDGEKEDIMVGFPRNTGIDRYSKILSSLNSLTEDEIDTFRMRSNMKKYNL